MLVLAYWHTAAVVDHWMMDLSRYCLRMTACRQNSQMTAALGCSDNQVASLWVSTETHSGACRGMVEDRDWDRALTLFNEMQTAKLETEGTHWMVSLTFLYPFVELILCLQHGCVTGRCQALD